jgi:hypothetical protein
LDRGPEPPPREPPLARLGSLATLATDRLTRSGDRVELGVQDATAGVGEVC